jgi:HK97 family phage major capsid protein
MALGAFLVGSFRFGATLYDRMGIEVLLSSENADDFEKNLLTMRAEQRLALAVKRPASFISGTFA